MNNTDKERVIERYNERIKKYGVSIDALASGIESRRQLRFKILKEIGVSQNDSILDLGCGFGDLYLFLEEELGKDNFLYTGFDINPTIIDAAKSKIPNATFLTRDILKEGIDEMYDFIVSTSSFNLRLRHENNYDFIYNILKTCYLSAKKGVAIDFLASYVDFQGSKEAFYYNPEEVFKIAKKITKRVTLRHDYPLFDFCIYLYPNFEGWKV